MCACINMGRHTLPFYSKVAGHLLIECVIALGIMTWVLSVSLAMGDWVGRLPHHYHAVALYQSLQQARALAIARDQDVELAVQNGALIQNQNTVLTPMYTLVQPYILTLNVPKLGFKASGRSKYAGTLTLQGRYFQNALTLDVGHGKITLK